VTTRELIAEEFAQTSVPTQAVVFYSNSLHACRSRKVSGSVKKFTAALVLALVPALAPLASAEAVGTVSASVTIPSVQYTGASTCVDVPVTLNVSGGVSNGFAYWNTENPTLSGPTSSPYAPGFFFDNEAAPGTQTLNMCPYTDRPGTYTYSADVWFHNWSDQGGDQYAGRVSATFTLSPARSAIAKVAAHKWRVKIIGQPYVVAYPHVRLQKYRSGSWHTIQRIAGNSGGKFTLRARPAGKYRLTYSGDSGLCLNGSTSPTFKRP